MKDNYRHKGKRRQLVQYLNHIGIHDEQVLKAINKVPRHLFLESVFEDFAYEDRAFPIASGQTISHPSTVAEQTQWLQVEKGEKVLEIGTGSGYQTAVLIAMGAKVYTVERQQELYEFSTKIFRTLEIRPSFQSFGDGFAGLPTFAPFDKILVTCGAAELPKKLLHQLKIGGSMVIPLGLEEEQTLTVFTKVSKNAFEKQEVGLYKFVPMLKNTEKR